MRIQNAYDAYRQIRPGRSIATLRAAIEAWRARHVAAGNDEYAEPLTDDGTEMQALVNQGRWMIRCMCGNGVHLPPRQEDHVAICPTCGTVWTNVVFPTDADEIEKVLTERRFRPTQNWNPGETVERLRQENVEKERR